MTTTSLPPHVISTDHPNHPSEGWSIAEMAWIAARDKQFLTYANQARSDLEAENARLRDALDDIAYRCDVDSLRAAIERARAALESKP